MSGDDVERHVREVAAVLGVADFVYSPTIIKKGNASREVSDGLLICDQGVAILQVKARERDAADQDLDAAARWLRRELGSALRQARGTLRSIRSGVANGSPVRAVAVRALEFSSDRWNEFAVDLHAPPGTPTIVVLDHPLAADIDVAVPAGVYVTTLDDWDELNRTVRSVNAVLRYVSRVLATQPIGDFRLGRESDRFAYVAAADTAYATQKPRSLPWFTLDGSHDSPSVELYRELLERVWGGTAVGPILTATECRLILNHLDDVPVGLQARVGDWIWRKRVALDKSGHRQSGVVVLDRGLFVYACDTEVNEPDGDAWKSQLITLAAARISAWHDQHGKETSAVCVGVREAKRGVEYTHVYASYELSLALPADIRQAVEGDYGVPDFGDPQS